MKRVFYLVLTFIVLIGCGTKKKASEIQKAEEKKKKDIVLNQKNDITTNTKIKKTETSFVFTPIDSNKPIIIEDETGIKKITNASVSTVQKKEEEKTEIEDKSITSLKDKSKIKTKVKNKTSQKEVDNSGYRWFWILLVVAGVLILGKFKKWF